VRIVAAGHHMFAARDELGERSHDLVLAPGEEVDVIEVDVRHDAGPRGREQERPVALVGLE
jgi:hypothetical protein